MFRRKTIRLSLAPVLVLSLLLMSLAGAAPTDAARGPRAVGAGLPASTRAQPPGGMKDDFVQTYLKDVPGRSAQKRKEFNAELDRLKGFSDGLGQKLADPQKQLGLGPESMRAEFGAIAGEQDEGKRAELIKAFDAKYRPSALKLYQTAGIDVQAEQGRMGMMLSPLPGNNAPRPLTLLAFFIPTPGGSSPPPPAPPDIVDRVFRAPYTGRGTVAPDRSYVDRDRGEIYLNAGAGIAGSEHSLAFITQSVPVERGVRRVRASATLDPVYHELNVMAVLGYASAEGIVNLRVTEGARELCGERVSLGRAVAAVVSRGSPSGRRPVTLQCDFTRAAPDYPSAYNLVAEFEGWAGAGGFARPSAFMSGSLQQFQVLLDRR